MAGKRKRSQKSSKTSATDLDTKRYTVCAQKSSTNTPELSSSSSSLTQDHSTLLTNHLDKPLSTSEDLHFPTSNSSLRLSPNSDSSYCGGSGNSSHVALKRSCTKRHRLSHCSAEHNSLSPICELPTKRLHRHLNSENNQSINQTFDQRNRSFKRHTYNSEASELTQFTSIRSKCQRLSESTRRRREHQRPVTSMSTKGVNSLSPKDNTNELPLARDNRGLHTTNSLYTKIDKLHHCQGSQSISGTTANNDVSPNDNVECASVSHPTGLSNTISPMYLVQKHTTESDEGLDSNVRILTPHVYIVPNYSHKCDSDNIKDNNNNSHSVHRCNVKDIFPTNHQVDLSLVQNNSVPMDLTLTGNPLRASLPPTINMNVYNSSKVANPVCSGFESQFSLTPTSLQNNIVLAASNEREQNSPAVNDASMMSTLSAPFSLITPLNNNNHNYTLLQTANLESFSPAKICNPPTSNAPVTYRIQSNAKVMADSSPVPLLSSSTNGCAPRLVAPSVSECNVSNNQSRAIQQLLNPVNVARLIALNQTSTHSAAIQPHKPMSIVTQVEHSTGNCEDTLHSTVSAQSGRYSHHSAHDPHSSTKPVVCTRNHTSSFTTCEWSNSRGSGHSQSGHHRNPHSEGINQRIAQLQQANGDRSIQLIILQDINQILLMDFEENLANLNVTGLVNCVLKILESDEDQLVELKNLSCNVLTHLIDVIPRSSDVIVPSLPILLRTMSSSFVGDILERIINLLEQLSRRHGKEVLRAGGVSTVLGFYDFVTSTQHRTILTMVYNCFISLKPADFELIADSLPTLAEHLKESEPRCTERVCSCFVRLIYAYRCEPTLLKRIVLGCDLLNNLQSLLTLSPCIQSGVHEVVLILATLSASCPDLATDLIKLNISNTLFYILTGKTFDCESSRALIISRIPNLIMQSPNSPQHSISVVRRHRTRSHSDGPVRLSSHHLTIPQQLSTNQPYCRHGFHSLPLEWSPLMISSSPLFSISNSNLPHLLLNQRSPEDVHAIVYLISELLPPVPNQLVCKTQLFASAASPSSSPSINFGSYANLNSSFGTSDSGLCTPEQWSSVTHGVGGAIIAPVTVLNNPGGTHGSSSSVSSDSSSTLLHGSLDSVILPNGQIHSTNIDPRALLLYQECEQLRYYLQSISSEYLPNGVDGNGSTTASTATISNNPACVTNSMRRRSVNHKTSEEVVLENTNHSHKLENLEAMQMVHSLLPILFEIFAETTRPQTRLLCLETIQRMVFHSSPLLLVKVIHPRVVCSHIAGMLNYPEGRLILMALQIALMFVKRIPLIFAAYFRKEGIIHRVDHLINKLKSGVMNTGLTSNFDVTHSVPESPVNESSLSTQQVVLDHCTVQQLSPPSSSPAECEHTHRSNVTETAQCRLLYDPSTVLDLTKPVRKLISFGSAVSPQDSSAIIQMSAHVQRNPMVETLLSGCSQLQEFVFSVLKSLDSLDHIHNNSQAHLISDLHRSSTCEQNADENKCNSPSIVNKLTVNLIDLMPILITITQQLNSSKPHLWISALSQLIQLLKPRNDAHRSIEPPSPFELQESGVTNALLQFLTALDKRELRLWIIFRLFLGTRATSPIRLSPGVNWEHVCGRKSNGHRNGSSWCNLLTVLPDLFGLDSHKHDEFSNVDMKLTAELNTFADPDCGVEAFNCLLDCLLSYLHRHENFQVHNLLPLLPNNNKWLSLLASSLNIGNSSNLPPSTQATSFIYTRSSNQRNHTNLDPAQSRVATVNSPGRSSSTRLSSQRAMNIKHFAKASHLNSLNMSQSKSPSETEDNATTSEYCSKHYGIPNHSLRAKSTHHVNPIPGLLRIELRHLIESENSNVDQRNQLGNSNRCTTQTSSSRVNMKTGRKSSFSSNSSGSSATSMTNEQYFSISNCSPLRITAVATVQNLERVLLQRNYINSILSESGFSSDQDQNCAAAHDTFIDPITDYDLTGSPQSQFLDATDEDETEVNTRNLLKNLASIQYEESARRCMNLNVTKKLNQKASRTHNQELQRTNMHYVNPTHSHHQSGQLHRWSAHNMMDSLASTSDHTSHNTDSLLEHSKLDTYAKHLSLMPNVRLDDITGQRTPAVTNHTITSTSSINPNIFFLSRNHGYTYNAQTAKHSTPGVMGIAATTSGTVITTALSTTVSSGTSSSDNTRNLSNTGPLQRGLRSLLQKSSEILPIMTRSSGLDKVYLNNTTEKAVTSDQHRKVVIHNLRRRSTTSGNLSDSFISSSNNPSSSNNSVNRSSTTFSHFLRSVTGQEPTSHEQHTRSDVSQCTRRRQKQCNTSSNYPVADYSESNLNSKTAASVSSNQFTARYRRLKSGSIFAALGALSGSSSTNNMGNNTQKSSSRRGRSGGTYGHHLMQSKAFTNPTSPSSQSSSTSKASLSPFSSGDGATIHMKVKPGIIFYLGGHRLPPDIPLFEAIRKFSPELSSYVTLIDSFSNKCCATESFLDTNKQFSLSEYEQELLIGHLIWSMTHLIHYRVVYNTPDTDTMSTQSRRRPNLCIPTLLYPSSSSSSPCSSPSATASSPVTSPPAIVTTTHIATSPSTSFSTFKYSQTHFGNSNNAPPTVCTTPISVGTAVTNSKRRRGDELQAGQTPTQTATDISNPAHLNKYMLSVSTTKSPLFSYLIPHLPNGFLFDPHCDCGMGVSAGCCTSVNATSYVKQILQSPTKSWDLYNTLALLRVLNSISNLWYTAHNVLDPVPICASHSFQSAKLTVKADRQLQDLFSVLSGNLPNWLIQLISICPFLFPFEIRRTFFYVFNFDRNRTLLRFQDSANLSTSESDRHHDHMGNRVSSPFVNSIGSDNVNSDYHIQMNQLFDVENLTTTDYANSFPVSTADHLASDPSALLVPQSPVSLSHDQTRSDPQRYQTNGHCSTTGAGLRGRYHLRLALTPNLRRHKVTVNRDNKRLLKQAESTLIEMGSSRAALEIAFEGEVGFGLGPTLEFYTLISKQLMKAHLGLWHSSEVTADGYVIAPPPGLYPRPLARQTKSSVVREICNKFNFLGRLMARALLDWRRLDLPLSPAFFKWFQATNIRDAVFTGCILPTDVSLVDPNLSKHIRQLIEIVNRRHCLCEQLTAIDSNLVNASGCLNTSNRSSLHSIKNSNHATKLDTVKSALNSLDNEVLDLCLNFTLPGYEVELMKNGSHINVTGSNLDVYLRLVAHWLTIEGVSRQMEAFMEGFDLVLPGVRPRLAALFQPVEMESLFCGGCLSRHGNYPNMMMKTACKSGCYPTFNFNVISDAEGWDVQSLTRACLCDHGYTPQSRAIRFLFEILSEFDAEQRRLFVQFITGSPRLPVGGFRALKPPLKIVMKREIGQNADNHLPSVMTCHNYLKLPDYSSKELMFSKLVYAIKEGQNAFHLS